jgi:type I restriction enzyme S subunit
MELKPGYKQSEAGVIPEDWRTYSLGKLLKFQNGRGFQQSEWTRTGLPIIRIQNLNDADADFNFFDGNIQDRYLVRPGDLLFAWSGTIGTSFGPRIWHGETGALNQHIFRVSKLSSELALSYALHLLESAATHIANQTHGFKSSFVHVKKRDLEKVAAALPPTIDEQERICEALKDFDSYISAIESLIAKKREIKQAAMQELLTGKRRLPGFEGEWEVKSLREIAKMPVTDGPHMTPRFLHAGVPFLSVNNLVNNRIDFGDLRFISKEDHLTFSRKCKPQKGDILLGKAASVGKVAIVDSDVEFNIWSPIALIRIAESSSPRFVFYALQSHNLVGQITLLTNASSQGNIGMGDIERLTFRLPSKEEQTAIASTLHELDIDIAALEARMEKAQHLKQGMLQQLLTGRIRLK